MICQSCHEASARFESGQGVLRLKICLRCLVKAGLHHLSGWRFLIQEGDAHLRCTNCRLSFEQFAKQARYGCPDCASTFQGPLDRIFALPTAMQYDAESEDIELALALLLEDYELAARIRDRQEKAKALRAADSFEPLVEPDSCR
jgi:protein-arginine kinase activator protein McsA